jgi:hypothetical protein
MRDCLCLCRVFVLPQGRPPYVYNDFQCIGLMASAAKSNDVAFIETMWQRMCEDVTRDPSSNARAPLFDSSSKLVNDISGDASGDPALQDVVSGSSKNSSAKKKQQQQKHPSAAAYAQLVKALVECEAYGKAFEYLYAMEQVYGGKPACSVYQGVRAFPEALDTEPKIAAAFAQLKARKVGGVKPGASQLILKCSFFPSRGSMGLVAINQVGVITVLCVQACL